MFSAGTGWGWGIMLRGRAGMGTVGRKIMRGRAGMGFQSTVRGGDGDSIISVPMQLSNITTKHNYATSLRRRHLKKSRGLKCFWWETVKDSDHRIIKIVENETLFQHCKCLFIHRVSHGRIEFRA